MSLPKGGNKTHRSESNRGRKQTSKKPTEAQQTEEMDLQSGDEVAVEELPEMERTEAKDSGPSYKLSCSQSLYKKLVSLSKEEGIDLEDLVKELVTEGVVTRAWDVAERKHQIRAGQNQNQNPRQSGGPNSNRGSGGGGHRKGSRMSQQRYQSIMDDKATFLEYVRSQERGNR
jgi:hypothetical protein